MFTRLSALYLLTGVALASPARADFSKYNCEGPSTGPVKAIVDEGNSCGGYRQADGKTVRFNFKGSGKLIASADGRTVVMVQSYLPGRLDWKAGEIYGDEGERSESKNPIAIRIYRDGALVATHRVHELLHRPRLASQSVSHVGWVRWMPEQISGATFSITTTSFRDLTFNAETGQLVNANDSTDWLQCDVIATGKMDAKNNKLVDAYRLKGEGSEKTIVFTLPRFNATVLTANSLPTVCLARHGEAWVLTRLL